MKAIDTAFGCRNSPIASYQPRAAVDPIASSRTSSSVTIAPAASRARIA